eukprot:4891105-Prymnesium_polylepis.1
MRSSFDTGLAKRHGDRVTADSPPEARGVRLESPQTSALALCTNDQRHGTVHPVRRLHPLAGLPE